MSWQDLEKAFEIIESIKLSDDFSGAKDQSLIDLAEETLNLKFPPTYKEFLKRYGTGGVNGCEILGLIHSDFENSGIPDAVWLTLKYRKKSNLKENFIIISYVSTGGYYAIDCSIVDKNGESPIVLLYPFDEKDIKKIETVATDFGQFLKNMISE